MTAPPREQKPVKPPGPVANLFILLASLLLAVIGSLFFGTLIEWAGMHYWWKDQGVAHSRDMVAEDLGYIAQHKRSIIVDDPVEFAASWANHATDAAAFIGVMRVIKLASKSPHEAANDTERKRMRWAALAAPYLTAMVHVWQDTAVRLAVVVLALPAFLLALAIGLIDGLGRRDVRRWSGGRESGYIFHQTLKLVWPAISTGFLLYLAWPTGGFDPSWMVLPFCIATAWVTSLLAATFKKYL